jgi:hypothetical protein
MFEMYFTFSVFKGLKWVRKFNTMKLLAMDYAESRLAFWLLLFETQVCFIAFYCMQFATNNVRFVWAERRRFSASPGARNILFVSVA